MSAFVLKYAILSVCGVAWVYAAFHGIRFEERLSRTSRDVREIEAMNHPRAMFRADLPKPAREARRKAFAGLAVFFTLGLALIVMLAVNGHTGSVSSPFSFTK